MAQWAKPLNMPQRLWGWRAEDSHWPEFKSKCFSRVFQHDRTTGYAM